MQRSCWSGRDLVVTLRESPIQCSLSKKDLLEGLEEGKRRRGKLHGELAGRTLKLEGVEAMLWSDSLTMASDWPMRVWRRQKHLSLT